MSQGTRKLTRVLRTIPSFYPYVTGPAKQAYNVAHGLEARGVSSPVYTTDYGARAAPREEEYRGVSVTRGPEGVGFMAYRRVHGIAEKLRGERPDLVHAHSYRSWLTEQAARLARERGIPFVLQPHGGLLGYRYMFQGLRRVPYLAYDAARGKRLVAAVDAVVVATEQEADEARAFGVANSKINVIPAGFHKPVSIPREQRDDDSLRMLFVGRLCPDRNLEQTLEALSLVQKQTSLPWTLEIVGGADVRSSLDRKVDYIGAMKSLAHRLGVAESVRFLGPLYGADLEAAYRRADLFVYTSRYENFGQTVLEAASLDLPVIATPTGVARDLVRQGESGWLCPIGDVQALANAMLEGLQDRGRLVRMRRAMHDRAAGYAWDAIIPKYVALYESLCD